MDAENVGIIGLGLMGSAMAKRLVARGFRVLGHDTDPKARERMAASGCRLADSPAEIASKTGVILLSLPTTAAVASVLEDEYGLLTTNKIMARVIVDTGTTAIEATHEFADAARKIIGLPWLDAPVSGGPAAAGGGSLAIMAGGSEGAFLSAEPVLRELGTVTRMGETGTGQATKLVNQTLVLNNFLVIAEAVRLAEAYGVDPTRIPAALGGGYAGSNLLPVLVDRMARRDWTPTGYARQLLKDLDLVLDAGKAKALAQPVTSQTAMLYRMAMGAGLSEQDGAAILELLPEGRQELTEPMIATADEAKPS